MDEIVPMSRGSRSIDASVHAEIVQDSAINGFPVRTIAKRLGLSKDTIWRSIQEATPDTLRQIKKEMAQAKMRISAMADALIIERMQNAPDKIGTSELIVASGVMAQRAMEIAKDSEEIPKFEWQAMPTADESKSQNASSNSDK